MGKTRKHSLVLEVHKKDSGLTYANICFLDTESMLTFSNIIFNTVNNQWIFLDVKPSSESEIQNGMKSTLGLQYLNDQLTGSNAFIQN